jgi:hypothetical protein
MKAKVLAGGGLVLTGLIVGCESVPPGVEQGPHGTIAYNVQVTASEPGVHIETNSQFAGTTPLTLKIFGDKDGTFHNFGSYFYTIRALPLNTNEFVQTRMYRTGRHFTPEDYVPREIYFDMKQPPGAYPLPPVYAPGYPYYGPGVYIGPPYPYPYYYPYYRRYYWHW